MKVRRQHTLKLLGAGFGHSCRTLHLPKATEQVKTDATDSAFLSISQHRRAPLVYCLQVVFSLKANEQQLPSSQECLHKPKISITGTCTFGCAFLFLNSKITISHEASLPSNTKHEPLLKCFQEPAGKAILEPALGKEKGNTIDTTLSQQQLKRLLMEKLPFTMFALLSIRSQLIRGKASEDGRNPKKNINR